MSFTVNKTIEVVTNPLELLLNKDKHAIYPKHFPLDVYTKPKYDWSIFKNTSKR